MTHAHPDAVGLIGAVDQVLRPAKAHGIIPERIVRAGADDLRQGIAGLRVLAADGFRRIPARLDFLFNDPGRDIRRRPALPPDAERISQDLARLALCGRRIIIQAHFRDIQDDPLLPGRRQDELRGQDDLLARARQPGVEFRVDQFHILITETIKPRDIKQGVTLPGLGGHDLADQRGAGIIQHIAQRLGGRRRAQIQQQDK